MLRTRNVLICSAAVALCLVGIALAKAVHQELVEADGNTIGKASLNYAKGANKTEIQVDCWDLDPQTEYLLLLCECDGGQVADCFELGSLTTNKQSKGHLHARVGGDYSDWCVVIGIAVEGDDGTVVTPCGYDTRIGLLPALPIMPIPGPTPPYLPVPGPNPTLPGPKVVDVQFDGYFIEFEDDDTYIIFNDESNIYITFDRAIDLSTVTANTFKVLEELDGTVDGSYYLLNEGCTVVFDPDGRYCMAGAGDDWFGVTLVGTADNGSEVMRSTQGIAIDGDADGIAGGDFEISFFFVD